ncbi:hypothetical protein CCR85_09870 [Rhodothalassium salexigens]|uniref:DUF1656 domain-containing protein n=1 Tax=Rhodothalassium salexigens TaxID=1086 RepID=UPI00191372E5|nr:DUF1656 domain-containing protein [Rhodothalassium salexigens]MBK5911793.1 hypothetical protein [Rhodothalassium salexigens]MBK5920351.1 hypothetical protein [Rhodothalassium salexigens]
MIEDLIIDGVFVSPFLVALVLAAVAARPVGLLLNRLGLYRLVWNPGVFDAALFFLLYAGFCCLMVPDILEIYLTRFFTEGIHASFFRH